MVQIQPLKQLKYERTKMTIINLKPHPLAEVFPMADMDSYKALVKDIKEHGLLERITVFEAKILDGRNRFKACIEAGIEPKTKPFEGDNPEEFVHSANINRRHLSKNWLAITAAECTKSPPTGGLSRITTKAAAEKYGVPVRSVERAKRIVDAGPSSLIDDVKSDKVSLSEAEERVKKSYTPEPVDTKDAGKSESKADPKSKPKTEDTETEDKTKDDTGSNKQQNKPKVSPKHADKQVNKPKVEQQKESYSEPIVEQHLKDIAESLSEMKSAIGSNTLTVEHKEKLDKLIVQAESLSKKSKPELENAA